MRERIFRREAFPILLYPFRRLQCRCLETLVVILCLQYQYL